MKRRTRRPANRPARNQLDRPVAPVDPPAGRPAAFREQGNSLARKRDFVNASECYRHALALDPEDPAARRSLGFVLMAMNRPVEAVECYEHVLRTRPHDAEAINNLATALVATGRLEAALDCYARLRPSDVVDAGTHNNIGNVLVGLGRLNEAINVYRRALEINPRHADAHSNLGAVLARLGRLEEAVKSCRQAIAINGSHPGAHVNLGSMLTQIGDFRAAVECYSRLVNLRPADSRAWLWLGAAQRGIGELEAATDSFREAHRLDPKNEKAAYLLDAATGGAGRRPPPKDYISEMFDGYAGSFDDHLVKGLRYTAPDALAGAVRAVTGREHADWTVWDLGCGTGLCAPLFRPLARRLIGIDLSPRMVEKARARNLYDALHVGDLIEFLREPSAPADLIIAADVFVYLGDLAPVFEACAAALRDGGLFAFTTEQAAGDSYQLRPTGRFAHAPDYLATLARATGLGVAHQQDVVGRFEGSEPVATGVTVLERPRDAKARADRAMHEAAV